MIHIWGLAQEQSRDAVKFIFDAYYRLRPLQGRHSRQQGLTAFPLLGKYLISFPDDIFLASP